MPQHQQLRVVGRRAPCQQHQPPHHLAEHQVEQSKCHPSIIGVSASLGEVAAQSLRPTFWHPHAAGDLLDDTRVITGRPSTVAAIVDRVTFNAHILETGTESYRLRTSKTSTRRKQAN
jgi:hypothetical protein